MTTSYPTELLSFAELPVIAEPLVFTDHVLMAVGSARLYVETAVGAGDGGEEIDGSASDGWKLPFKDSVTAMFQSEVVPGRRRVAGVPACLPAF